MMRKQALRELDFSNPYDAWFDWWMLIQLSLRGKFFYLSEKKTRWRIHSASYIHCFNSRLDLYKESCLFLERMWSLMKDYCRNQNGKQNSELLDELRLTIHRIEKVKPLIFLGQVIKREVKKSSIWMEITARRILKIVLGSSLYANFKGWYYQRFYPKEKMPLQVGRENAGGEYHFILADFLSAGWRWIRRPFYNKRSRRENKTL